MVYLLAHKGMTARVNFVIACVGKAAGDMVTSILQLDVVAQSQDPEKT